MMIDAKRRHSKTSEIGGLPLGGGNMHALSLAMANADSSRVNPLFDSLSQATYLEQIKTLKKEAGAAAKGTAPIFFGRNAYIKMKVVAASLKFTEDLHKKGVLPSAYPEKDYIDYVANKKRYELHSNPLRNPISLAVPLAAAVAAGVMVAIAASFTASFFGGPLALIFLPHVFLGSALTGVMGALAFDFAVNATAIRSAARGAEREIENGKFKDSPSLSLEHQEDVMQAAVKEPELEKESPELAKGKSFIADILAGGEKNNNLKSDKGQEIRNKHSKKEATSFVSALEESQINGGPVGRTLIV